GTDGLTNAQIQEQLQRGARFVIYQYCISVLVMTFKRPSDIYFVPAGERSVTRGLGFSAATLLLGWWGIPWGPIYSIQSLWVNFSGGRDVTNGVVPPAPPSQATPQARRA